MDAKRPSCDAEQIRLTNCLKIRLSSSIEAKEQWRNKASEDLAKVTTVHKPLFPERTEPPESFHDYQKLSSAEKDKLFVEIMSGAQVPSH